MARLILDEPTHVQGKPFFSSQIHDVENIHIKDGDILIFPENYTVIERPIHGTQDTVEFMNIKCMRGCNEITIPFYPCFFYKTRRKADPNTKKPTGVYLHSNGEVVDFVQGCEDINEAIKSIAKNHPNGVLVHFGNEKTLRYGQPEDGTGKLQNANVPTLTWASSSKANKKNTDYTNEEIEIEMRKNYDDYLNFAKTLHYCEEVIRKIHPNVYLVYDIYCDILVKKYERKEYIYRFNLCKKHSKGVLELFQIKETPDMDAFLEYKNILETCIYLAKTVNPTDNVFHVSLQLVTATDISSILYSPASTKISDNFYLVDINNIINDQNLYQQYCKMTWPAFETTLIYTEKTN